MFLFVGIIFFIISFLLFFYTKKSVNYLIESKKKHLKSQGYSDERIDKWIKPKDWYLFYKLSGAFGLITTLIAIFLSIRNFIKG